MMEAVLNTTKVRRWKRYSEYIKSGATWRPEVPSSWQVCRLKYLVKMNPSKSEVAHLSKNTEVSFLPMENIGEDGSLNLKNTKRLEEVYDGFTYFRNDDVLVAKITPCFENGKGALAQNLKNGVGFGTTELQILRPTAKISGRYLEYITRLHAFRGQGVSEFTGAAGQQRVPESFIGNYLAPLPSKVEQQRIVSFLDRETARIDALIGHKQRLIELLEEKRQAVISHAVTKGLDPNVEMKDSGVNWLGKLPNHWIVSRLKFACSLIKDGTHLPPKRTQTGYPLLSVRNLVDGELVNLSDDSMVSEQDFIELRRQLTVKKNDILLAVVGATIGKVAIVGQMEPFAIQRSLGVLRPDISKLDVGYLALFLQSTAFQQLLWERTSYSAQPGIYLNDLENFNIALPSLIEQRSIVSVIKDQIVVHDKALACIRQGIEKLNEYRSALISAAVTGQIDVREEVNLDG